jgi:hypothetical protein
MFTAQYALSLYIKETHIFFIGLVPFGWVHSVSVNSVCLMGI